MQKLFSFLCEGFIQVFGFLRVFVSSWWIVFSLLACDGDHPQPTERFVIQGTSQLDAAGNYAFDLTAYYEPISAQISSADSAPLRETMLTLPSKFKSHLGQGNQPSYIVKLLESETYNEQTLQAHWAANTGALGVDYTPTPPATGDVVLANHMIDTGGLWANDAPCPRRFGHSAVFYNNKIYIFGGDTGSGRLNDIWEYDLIAHVWTQKTSGATIRSLHSAVIYNGKMYVFGGWDSGSGYLNDVWEYNISGDSWLQKTSGATIRRAHSAVESGGKMYIFGGYNGSVRLNNVWEYNITGDSWTQKTSGATIRERHSAIISNGKMYIFGGWNGTSRFNDVWEYNISGDSWIQKTSGATIRRLHSANNYNGKIYIFGGANATAYLNDLYEYDIPTDTWKQHQPDGEPGTLPAARESHSAVEYNGKLYVFGGLPNNNELWEYDLASHKWTQKTSGATARYGHSAIVYNGKMYVFGGYAGGVNVNEVWEYNISGDSWTQKTSGASIRSYHSAVEYNGKMYIFGGSNVGTYLNDVWEYNIAGDSWTQKTSGASVRQAPTAIISSGKMYIFGGYNTPNIYLNDVWEYNISGDSWTQKTSGASIRRQHSAIEYNGKMYIFGGYNGSATLNDVWEYNISGDSWTQKTSGASIRSGHSAIGYNGKMYIFGGINAGTPKNDTWVDLLGYAKEGYIITQVMDLGSVPAVDGIWRFQNLTPTGTSLIYHAWASDTGAFAGEETVIGNVVDGQAITVRKRYYKVRASSFPTTIADAGPTLRSIMARFPVYRGYSDNPRLGYEAALDSVSALSTKIGDFEPSSISQVTANLAFTKSVSDYLKTKYPKNKEVRLLAGFIADGFIETDYYEYYRGIIDDWDIGVVGEKIIVSIKVKDFSRQWDVPVPAKWQTTGDNKTWTAMHPVDVMLDIFQGYIGSTDAELDLNSFNEVKIATAGWIVTRTITGNTIPAKDLLEELRRLLSAYFIPQPNGRIKLKRFNASAAADGSLTDRDFITKKWEGNAASLINQLNIYFNWDGSGDNLSDFTAWDLAEDATSKANWKETITEEIKDKWTVSAQSAQVVARREIIRLRYANPPEKFTATVDMRHMEYETGDILNISTLRAPSSDMSGIADKPFQIIQKTPDFNRDRLTLVLLRQGST